jgi:hypothetical protein
MANRISPNVNLRVINPIIVIHRISPDNFTSYGSSVREMSSSYMYRLIVTVVINNNRPPVWAI